MALENLVDKWHTGKPEFVEFQDPTDTRGARVVVDLTVVEGPLKGERARYWGNLKGGARPITEKQLTAMGWTGRSIKTGAGIGRNNVRFLVKNESFNGKVFTKVVAVTAAKKFDDAPAYDNSDAPTPDCPF